MLLSQIDLSCGKKYDLIGIQSWNERKVREWIADIGLPQMAPPFQEHNITGDVLLDLTHDSLKDMNIKLVGHRMKVLIILKRVKAFLNESQYLRTPDRKSNPKSNLLISTSPAALQYDQYNTATTSNTTGTFVIKSSSGSAGHKPSYYKQSIQDMWGTAKSGKSDGSVTPRGKISANSSPNSVRRRQSERPEDESSSSRKKILRVIGEENQSRMVDVTGLTDPRHIYQRVFHKFNIYRGKNDAGLDQQIQNWSFWTNVQGGALKEIRDEDLPSVANEVSSFDDDVSKVVLRKRPVISPSTPQSSAKIKKFFGEEPRPLLKPINSKQAIRPSQPSPVIENWIHHSKLQKIIMERPSSELISDNLNKYFPNVKKKQKSDRSEAAMKEVPKRFKDSLSPPNVNSSMSPSTLSQSHAPSSMLSTSPLTTKSNLSSSAPSERRLEVAEKSSLEEEPSKDATEEDSLFEEIPSLDEDEAPQSADIAQGKGGSGQGLNISTSVSAGAPVSDGGVSPISASLKRNATRKIKWVKGSLIGTGSFGNVYMGLNALTGELMAVKQVSLPEELENEQVGDPRAKGRHRKKQMVEALQREISLLKELEHPNIVRYLGSESSERFLNIFLEYVPGGSLSALLSSYGTLEEGLVMTFIRQVLNGLAYLHEKNIVHRDIKGGNILVDNKGVVKISDFGISKKMSDGNDRGSVISLAKQQNRTSTLQGSVFWMAPEVVSRYHYTRKSDIWSVGCLIIEMFTGQHPWPDFSQMQAMFKIGSNEIPPLPQDLSSNAKDFLNKCLELKYKDRPDAIALLQHPFLQSSPIEDDDSGVIPTSGTPNTGFSGNPEDF